MTEERTAYEKAYKFALQNATEWLNISKYAKSQGYNGQAYSVAITAYEELGKAYVSWLAAEEFIALDDAYLDEIFRSHVLKTLVSLYIGAADIGLEMLRMGMIDPDDILRDAILSSEESVMIEIAEASVDLEDKRREGMYVDLWEEEDGNFLVTSPSEFKEQLTSNIIGQVERVQTLIEGLIEAVTMNEQIRDWFKTAIESSMTTSDT